MHIIQDAHQRHHVSGNDTPETQETQEVEEMPAMNKKKSNQCIWLFLTRDNDKSVPFPLN